MVTAADAPTIFLRTELTGHDQPKCRVITPTDQSGWSEPVLFEWELTAESWTDQHPHTEYNFVIEGQLFIESDGVTIEAQSGRCSASSSPGSGPVLAPTYARLLAIYGPSNGEPSRRLGYERLNNPEAGGTRSRDPGRAKTGRRRGCRRRAGLIDHELSARIPRTSLAGRGRQS